MWGKVQTVIWAVRAYLCWYHPADRMWRRRRRFQFDWFISSVTPFLWIISSWVLSLRVKFCTQNNFRYFCQNFNHELFWNALSEGTYSTVCERDGRRGWGGGWVGGWCYQALIGAPNLDTLKEESRAWESLWAGKGRCSTEVCGHRWL